MDFSAKMDKIDLNSEMRRLNLDPRPHERVFAVIPKHIGKIFPSMMASTVTTILFLIVLFIVATSGFADAPVYFGLTIGMGIAYFLIIAFTVADWFGYKHSALVFTSQRIIDTDYKAFFTRQTNELDIRAVQNAYGADAPILGTIFKYGTLTIDRIGADPTSIQYLPIPQLAAEQTMHFHDLVAHGGIDKAHNFMATALTEDETPELAKIIQQTEEIAERSPTEIAAPDPTGPKPGTLDQRDQDQQLSDDQPDRRQPEAKKQPVKVLSFEIPTGKVGETLENLPTATEPQVNYVSNKDMFEVEAVVIDEEAEQAKQKLEEEGAQTIKENGQPIKE